MDYEAKLAQCERERELEHTDIEEEKSVGEMINESLHILHDSVRRMDCAIKGHFKCDDKTCIL